VAETVDPSTNPERIDTAASAAQVRAAGRLGDTPLVVVSRSPYFYSGGNQSPITPLEKVWQELQLDLCQLSSNQAHIIATKAGHFLQVDEPQLVIEAIHTVMAAAKKRE
jgi:hypothetical protein